MRIDSASSVSLSPALRSAVAEAPVSSADPVDRWKPTGAVATPFPKPNFAPSVTVEQVCARLQSQFADRMKGTERATIAVPVELGWRPQEEHDEVLDICDAIMDGGGIPMLVHQRAGDPVGQLAGVDGIALPGGRDISPDKYGAKLGPGMDPSEPDPAWDDFEIALIQHSYEKGLPMLGHCRGYQLMNCAEVPESLHPPGATGHVGGTMTQDIPTEFHSPAGWNGHVQHRPESVRHDYASRVTPVHMIAVAEGTPLAEVAGALQSVNSVHHQCLAAISPLLVPVAWALDGVVEGVQRKSMPWQSGYQFHAEALRYTDGRYQKLYDNLVDNAARFRNGELKPQLAS